MSELDLLLTDEYVKFSQKIAELHASKKSLNEDFKVVKEQFQKAMETFKANVKAVEDAAKAELETLEAWKQSRDKKKDE